MRGREPLLRWLVSDIRNHISESEGVARSRGPFAPARKRRALPVGVKTRKVCQWEECSRKRPRRAAVCSQSLRSSGPKAAWK